MAHGLGVGEWVDAMGTGELELQVGLGGRRVGGGSSGWSSEACFFLNGCLCGGKNGGEYVSSSLFRGAGGYMHAFTDFA